MLEWKISHHASRTSSLYGSFFAGWNSTSPTAIAESSRICRYAAPNGITSDAMTCPLCSRMSWPDRMVRRFTYIQSPIIIWWRVSWLVFPSNHSWCLIESLFNLIANISDEKSALSFAYADKELQVDFEPHKIFMSPKSGRVYHPAHEQYGSIGLIRSKMAIEFSRFFEFEHGEQAPPTHFTWQNVRLELETNWLQDIRLPEHRECLWNEAGGVVSVCGAACKWENGKMAQRIDWGKASNTVHKLGSAQNWWCWPVIWANPWRPNAVWKRAKESVVWILYMNKDCVIVDEWKCDRCNKNVWSWMIAIPHKINSWWTLPWRCTTIECMYVIAIRHWTREVEVMVVFPLVPLVSHWYHCFMATCHAAYTPSIRTVEIPCTWHVHVMHTIPPSMKTVHATA